MFDDPIAIDKTTGAATVTASSLGTARTGVASESATSIFVKLAADLYSVDVGSGTPTLVMNLSVANLHNFLENTPAGDLISGFRSESGTQLYGIDSTTYAVTTLGFAGDVPFAALAYSIDISVPEPTTVLLLLLLLLLGLGLAGLGLSKRRLH